MKPYAGLFLTDRAHRHDSNLALRRILKRFHPYKTPFDTAQGFRIAHEANFIVLIRD
jgi:hypothetical protein